MKKWRNNGFVLLFIMAATTTITNACGYFEVQSKTVEPIESSSTAEEFMTTVILDRSILEVDDELLTRFNDFMRTYNKSFFEEVTPFEVFQLYMYTLAGEDYGTLYHFHPEESVLQSKDAFIKDGRNDVNLVQNRELMKRVNEVREVMVHVEEGQARIQFRLEEPQETLTFQLVLEGKRWFVMPMPMQ
ncbi:hypothetical protein JCM9140_2651 [Halalkalibacter wakoensis JCM 9140]|uniref:Lipoprotein n=1 Tax=Halalkalibacter wakoensis JCM 9140 TaxID=1236970 RepID=W4Q5D8_9BACI|nr:hypothetical protein [Halalkalibacter wakoensis]GAE26569.1 hypothetical protein JCM9140_2651 [Halalkalibacter wakoensis JCM 9140]